MARPRAPTYDDQRAQILKAAAALFARRGWTATTMNEVAADSGVSKATLYHYFDDKRGLLEHIARRHVERLEALLAEVPPPQPGSDAALRELIVRFMQAYADAGDEHRVLTEDVKFLDAPAQRAVVAGQRRVVAGFAAAVAAARPDLAGGLHKPLAMLLFGMMNWTFTWLKPGGALTHASLAPVVTDLFVGGLERLRATPAEPRVAAPRRGASARRPRAPA